MRRLFDALVNQIIEDLKFMGCLMSILVTALVAIVVIFIIAIAGDISDGCDDTPDFECLDRRVQECLKSENYTRDECLVLTGDSK